VKRVWVTNLLATTKTYPKKRTKKKRKKYPSELNVNSSYMGCEHLIILKIFEIKKINLFITKLLFRAEK
jgi:hypothetical protein